MACISFALSKPVGTHRSTMRPFWGLDACKWQTESQGEMCSVSQLALQTQTFNDHTVNNSEVILDVQSVFSWIGSERHHR